MAVKNPQFEINIRQNTNSSSLGYGKYYPKAVEKATISLRGLCDHMADHHSIYGRDLIEGVLTKMTGCITELLSQGNPVKIDGLGTFVPTVESVKNGILLADILDGKWNANQYVKAVHIRFRPEGAGDDDITSRNFKQQCALTTYGVEEKVCISPDGTAESDKEYIKRVTPLEDWIAQQKSAETGGSGSGSGSGSTTDPEPSSDPVSGDGD